MEIYKVLYPDEKEMCFWMVIYEAESGKGHALKFKIDKELMN